MGWSFVRALMLISVLCLGAAARPALAQSVSMAKMLEQTGYTYKTHNATTWSIDLDRKNTGTTKVILSTGDDMLVTFVILAKKAAIKKTPQLLEALARANHDYDYTKIGLDKDGDLFVRIDTKLRLLDAAELKYVIDQVANASNELYPKLSAWAKR
jgi:hypothetical protein